MAAMCLLQKRLQEVEQSVRDSSEVRVYLAGPEVFLPAAKQDKISSMKKKICAQYGLIGVHPGDADVPSSLADDDRARAIYESNISLMKGCQTILANITPFRGPGADGGTTFELGYFTGGNKISFAYTDMRGDYEDRCNGEEVDKQGYTVDMQHQVDNCMVTESVWSVSCPKSIPVTDSLEDDEESMHSFTEAVMEIAKYFGTHPCESQHSSGPPVKIARTMYSRETRVTSAL